MNATVESQYDDGSAETFRDENGGLWRVAMDGADGTLAVEEIYDYGGGPTITAIQGRPTVGDRPCGIARWHADGVDIWRCDSHGENHTDPTIYGANSDAEISASPNGWNEVAYLCREEGEAN